MTLFLFVSGLGCSNIAKQNPDVQDTSGTDHSISWKGTLPEPNWRTKHQFSCESPAVHHQQPLQEKVLPGDWSQQPPGQIGENGGWGIVVDDWNQDDRWDVFLPQFGTSQIFWGQVDGTVSLSPLDQTQDLKTLGGVSSDLNNDGFSDLLLANLGQDVLLINEGDGGFQRYNEDEWSNHGPENYRTQHFSLGDGNGDGELDIYGATFYVQNSMEIELNPNLLYTASDDKWVREDFPDSMEWSPANAGGWVDIDDDGQIELYLVNDKPHSGYRCGVIEYVDSEWKKWDVGHGLDVAIEGMGLATGDINNDGLIDFAITGWSEHALLINNGNNQWYEASELWGLNATEERVVGWGISFADMDNDGDNDVLVAYGPAYSLNGEIGAGLGFPNVKEQYLSLYLNHGDHVELVSSHQWDFGPPGNFRGFVLVDWNGDGYLDVFARDLLRQARYYESNCGENKAIHISLLQNGANPKAVGARIWIDTGEARQFRDVTAGSTNISSSGPPVVYFGVGQAENVDIRVRWPDGEESVLREINTQQWIEVSR